MTDEECLHICEIAIKCFEQKHSRISHMNVHSINDLINQITKKEEERQAISKIINALEKQIPKPPKIEKYKHRRDKGYYCAECGDWLGTVGIPLDFEAVAFCQTCGQAIDWSDKD